MLWAFLQFFLGLGIKAFCFLSLWLPWQPSFVVAAAVAATVVAVATSSLPLQSVPGSSSCTACRFHTTRSMPQWVSHLLSTPSTSCRVPTQWRHPRRSNGWFPIMIIHYVKETLTSLIRNLWANKLERVRTSVVKYPLNCNLCETGVLISNWLEIRMRPATWKPKWVK